MSLLNNNNVRPRLVTVGRGRSINPPTTDFRTAEVEVDDRNYPRNNNQRYNEVSMNARGKVKRGLSEDEGDEERILKLQGELAIAR